MRYGRVGQRDGNEPGIIAALEKVGARVLQLHQFDLLVKFRGQLFALEVKDPLQRETQRGSRERERQDAFLAEWGIPKVKTAEEALRAIGAVRAEPYYIHEERMVRNMKL